MILIIDNYDSFTYNLFQYVGSINPDIQVYRNDKITVDEIEKKNPSHIIISPGPKYPKDAGICIELIQKLYTKFPILGVCLGHQSICEAFGGNTVQAPTLVHGKVDKVKIVDKSSKIFAGMTGDIIEVARYHSLVTDKDTLPDCLKITSETKDGLIMSLEHKEYPVFGLQFHPESIMTPDGIKFLSNFLKGSI